MIADGMHAHAEHIRDILLLHLAPAKSVPISALGQGGGLWMKPAWRWKLGTPTG